MFTKNGRTLTAKGIKPLCPFHQVFKSTYLFGVFSPIDGDHFILEMPVCNTQTFQIFLNEFSDLNRARLNILVLDNAAFHKSKLLTVPDNIVLLYQPPYSPELNAVEKIWQDFKRDFTNRLFTTMEQLIEYVNQLACKLSPKQVKSITGFEYVFLCPYWYNK